MVEHLAGAEAPRQGFGDAKGGAAVEDHRPPLVTQPQGLAPEVAMFHVQTGIRKHSADFKYIQISSAN